MYKRLAALGAILLLIAALVPACAKEKGDEYGKTKETVERGSDETGEYLSEERASFQKEAEEKLSGLEARLKELRAEAETRGEKFAREHKEQMDSLENMIRDARARLDELKSSSEKAWSHLREGFDKAYAEMETAFKQAGDEFKKQQ